MVAATDSFDGFVVQPSSLDALHVWRILVVCLDVLGFHDALVDLSRNHLSRFLALPILRQPNMVEEAALRAIVAWKANYEVYCDLQLACGGAPVLAKTLMESYRLLGWERQVD